jgi:hypothetical protein
MSAFPRAGYGGHLSYNTKQAMMWEDGYTTINHQSFAPGKRRCKYVLT